MDIIYNVFFYPCSKYRLNIKINQLHIFVVYISLSLSLASLPTESNYAGILVEIKI